MAYTKRLAGALFDRGFFVKLCADRTEAKALMLEDIGQASVGFGGSVTVDKIGLYEALEERGNPVFWHWKSDAPDILDKAATTDVYVSSANAITMDGRLVNIDGRGNRVASHAFGHKKVLIALGRNKIVEGGIDEAIARIKNRACGPNACRLGLDTPCAVTFQCSDCRSLQRICAVTTITERPPSSQEYIIYLIGEDLGF